MNFYELEKIYVNPFKNERDNNNVQTVFLFFKKYQWMHPCIHLHLFCRSTFLKFKYLIGKGMKLMRIFFSLDT